MVWARVPPDRLIHLPLFGIDVIGEDPVDLHKVWMRGPSGRMCVDKRTPRVWFESVADAHQAGAPAIRLRTEADFDEAAAYSQSLIESAAASDSTENGDASGES
jgi:hypothetical protein